MQAKPRAKQSKPFANVCTQSNNGFESVDGWCRMVHVPSIVVSPSSLPLSLIYYYCMDTWFTTPLSRFSFSLSLSRCKSICLLKMDLNKEKKKLSEAIYFDGGEEGELNTLKNRGWLWLSLLSVPYYPRVYVCMYVCTYMAHYYYNFLKKDEEEERKRNKKFV